MNIKQLRQDKADNDTAVAVAEVAQSKLRTEGRGILAVAADKRSKEQIDRFAALDAEMATLLAQEAQLKEKAVTIATELARAERYADDERKLTGDKLTTGTNHAAEKKVSFGEFLQGIALTSLGKAEGLPEHIVAAVTGASAGAPVDGGFLVRAEWSTALLEKATTAGVLAPKCMRIPIGPDADGIEAPYVNETSRATGSRWGGVQVYRAAEAATVTGTKPGLGKFELRLEDLMGLFYATNRLIRDASALESLAFKAFSSEFAFKLDDEIIRGDGAGQCLGILNAPALVTVAKETGQTAATIKAENILKMYSRMLASEISTAVWYINQECLPQLQQMYIATGVGGQLIYMPPNGVASAPFGTLLGKPIIPIEQCTGLGSVGDILFLSLDDDYVLIEKPMTSDSSMHVRFINNEMTYRWVWPIIGRPLLQSAITPYKATTATTLSPFVALAAR